MNSSRGRNIDESRRNIDEQRRDGKQRRDGEQWRDGGGADRAAVDGECAAEPVNVVGEAVSVEVWSRRID